MTIDAYTVSKAYVWYNDEKIIVKMYFLNDIPFTFDDLPVGHLYDRDLVEEATKNKAYEIEDVYKGSNYLIAEQCHPCLLYTSPSPRDPKTSRMPSSA